MKIQSLSVVVPNEKCINNCAFCVSKMHDATYPNLMDINDPLYDLHLKDYLKRLAFARDNGCNTVMLTGTSEPQQNKQFLTMFGLFMQMLDNPFKIIEMQTAGTLLDADYLRFLRHHVGVNTISLSLSALDSFKNAEYNGIPHGHNFVISTLCQQIKHEGFTLRLSLNLTDAFNGLFDNATGANYFLKACKDLDADQITFRVLYGDKDTPQGQWIKHHGCTEETIANLKKYIRENGKALGVLEFGATRYSLAGMSTVLDTDCMSTTPKTEFKYLILRPDCKLYSHWNDKASLIF